MIGHARYQLQQGTVCAYSMLDGAMADLEEVFSCMRGEERAQVFMQLLYRRVQVTINISRLAVA